MGTGRGRRVEGSRSSSPPSTTRHRTSKNQKYRRATSQRRSESASNSRRRHSRKRDASRKKKSSRSSRSEKSRSRRAVSKKLHRSRPKKPAKTKKRRKSRSKVRAASVSTSVSSSFLVQRKPPTPQSPVPSTCGSASPCSPTCETAPPQPPVRQPLLVDDKEALTVGVSSPAPPSPGAKIVHALRGRSTVVSLVSDDAHGWDLIPAFDAEVAHGKKRGARRRPNASSPKDHIQMALPVEPVCASDGSSDDVLSDDVFSEVDARTSKASHSSSMECRATQETQPNDSHEVLDDIAASRNDQLAPDIVDADQCRSLDSRSSDSNDADVHVGASRDSWLAPNLEDADRANNIDGDMVASESDCPAPSLVDADHYGYADSDCEIAAANAYEHNGVDSEPVLGALDAIGEDKIGEEGSRQSVKEVSLKHADSLSRGEGQKDHSNPSEGDDGLFLSDIEEMLDAEGELNAEGVVNSCPLTNKEPDNLSPLSPPEPEGEVAALIAELASEAEAFDPADYWDGNAWDLQGLRDDVALQQAEKRQLDNSEFAQLHQPQVRQSIRENDFAKHDSVTEKKFDMKSSEAFYTSSGSAGGPLTHAANGRSRNIANSDFLESESEMSISPARYLGHGHEQRGKSASERIDGALSISGNGSSCADTLGDDALLARDDPYQNLLDSSSESL